MLRHLSRLLRGTAAAALAIGLVTATASAAVASADGNGSHIYTVCSPRLTGTAFPEPGSTGHPPPIYPSGQCTSTFAWGYTVSRNPTGQAEWDSPNVNGMSCTADAWIPDSHSNDPNAQYYFYDGSHYLGNDAFVNQESVTNNWVNVTNNSSFTISSDMRITLNDHNPEGQAGWNEAAYAVRFICS
jgi:hypothetical protein